MAKVPGVRTILPVRIGLLLPTNAQHANIHGGDGMRLVLLHYHIFKNAGSTIEDALDDTFGGAFGRLEEPGAGHVISREALVRHLDAHAQLRALSSHQTRYPLPVAKDYLFFDICFLRDPLDRVRSYYDYFRQRPNPDDPVSDLANARGLGDFVEAMLRDYSLLVRDNQVNLLACGGDSDEPGERDLEVAIRRVKAASFLGVVDLFAESVAAGIGRLRAAFPRLRFARPAANVSKGMVGSVTERAEALRAACRPSVFEALLRMTELDRRLVEAARAEVLRRHAEIRIEAPIAEPAHSSVWFEDAARRRLARQVFDAEWYLERNPDVRAAGIDPLRHYLVNGAEEDRKPCRWFDPVYYRESKPGTMGAGENPLIHFLRAGSGAASPHPLFDCSAYRAAYPEVVRNGANPLVHYLSRRRMAAGAGLFELFDVPVDESEPQQAPFLRSVGVGQLEAQMRLR